MVAGEWRKEWAELALRPEHKLLLRLRIGRSHLTAWMVLLHHLLVMALHLLQLFLLVGVQKAADLIIRSLMDVHHLGPAVLLRKRRIRVDTLHLRLL